jgi:hypothetical protein
MSDLPTRNLSAYFDGLPRRPHASRSQFKIEPSLGRTRAWVISVESQMPQNRGKAAIRRVPTVQISLTPPTSQAVAAISGEQREMSPCGLF